MSLSIDFFPFAIAFTAESLIILTYSLTIPPLILMIYSKASGSNKSRETLFETICFIKNLPLVSGLPSRSYNFINGWIKTSHVSIFILTRLSELLSDIGNVYIILQIGWVS
ncbi:Uncharacterised protein [uncultured archaeon]|nr:Uncharacterised protein [uncultured archaeon]